LKLDQMIYNSNIIKKAIEEPNKQEEADLLEQTTLDLAKNIKYKLSDWVNNSLKCLIYELKLKNKVKEINLA
ncbi:22603_t:CDS:1, partial [Gigaspora margarita]